MPQYTVKLWITAFVDVAVTASNSESAGEQAVEKFYNGITAEPSSLLALEDIEAEAHEVKRD